MPELRLLTAPDCHLCDHSRRVLEALEREGALTWREVSVDDPEGAELSRVAPPMRPVLFAGERILGYGRLSEQRLRKRLASSAGGC